MSNLSSTSRSNPRSIVLPISRAHAGIPTFIDDKHAVAHNKMIIDKTGVIAGSVNFTKAAEEKTAENLIIIQSKDLAQKYIENWEKHKAHSEYYQGR